MGTLQDGIDPVHESENDNSIADQKRLLYKVNDVPPWYLCVLLGLQQYLTMFGSTVSIPYILAPSLCIADDSPARAHLVSSILFSSGIITILQATLPIVQGATVAFLVPILSMLSLPEYKCPDNTNAPANDTNLWRNLSNLSDGSGATAAEDSEELWYSRMRLTQGSIVVASLLEVGLGFFGCIGAILRFISPLTIVPTITLVGLSLFVVAVNLASEQWAISMATVVLLFLFSQYMYAVKLPIPKFSAGKGFSVVHIPVFALLPVLLTILIMWVVCVCLTAADLFEPGAPARTDARIRIIQDSPWVRVPYPGQWGLPTVSTAGVIGLFAGIFASIVESVGDYYACARLSGAPSPPGHAINRGILIEGFGCIIAGLFGTGVGTTSYSENIGAIGITRVASRRVIQVAGLLMIILGMFTKFGALFVSIPSPIVGGIFLVMFGMITAVGLSGLQFVDLNSPRNLAICGFSLFAGLSIPMWISNHRDAIQTGNSMVDQTLTVVLSTSMLVGGLLGCFLDNTVPGSDDERGLTKWKELSQQSASGDATSTFYDVPLITPFLRRHRWCSFIPFLPAFSEAVCWDACCHCCRRKRDFEVGSDDTAKAGSSGKVNYGFDVSSV